MTTHTPGPFTVTRGRDKVYPFEIEGGEGERLARVVMAEDAQLFSAAEDLLDAVKSALRYVYPACQDGRFEARQLADQLNAAIVKATGGQS